MELRVQSKRLTVNRNRDQFRLLKMILNSSGKGLLIGRKRSEITQTLDRFIPYFINGARSFVEFFIQILVIFMIDGLFERIFIDWFWVGKTKAWIIPGTEDLMPYVPKKTMIRKCAGTLIVFPLLAAILAYIMSLLM